MYLKLRDGCQLRLRIIGRGKPVILLHGFGLNANQWLAHAITCSKNHSFIIPDFRGHGSSKHPIYQESNPLETLMLDLDELIYQLDLSDFKLCGYSMGALVGLAHTATMRHPKQHSYLHIEAGPKFHSDDAWAYGFNPDATSKALELMALLPENLLQQAKSLKELPGQFVKAYREFVWLLARIAFPPGLFRRLVQRTPDVLCQPWLPDWQFTCRLFRWLLDEGFDFIPSLSGIKVPVHLVAARHTEYFPAPGIEAMQGLIPNSKFTMFDHSGHGLMLSEPIKFIRSFRDFVRQG